MTAMLTGTSPVSPAAPDVAAGQAVRGEPEAFLELFRLCVSELYRTASRLVGSSVEAFPRVRSAASKVYDAALAGTLDASVGVQGALRRELVAESLRAPKGGRLASLSATEQTLSDLATTLSPFPAPERAAFLLRHFDGLSGEELAHALGRPIDEAEAAVQRLEAALGPDILKGPLERWRRLTSTLSVPPDLQQRVAEDVRTKATHQLNSGALFSGFSDDELTSAFVQVLGEDDLALLNAATEVLPMPPQTSQVIRLSSPRPEVESEGWYLGLGEEAQVGPVGSRVVRQMLTDRELTSDTLCWREGFKTWLPLGRVVEFSDVALQGEGLRPISGVYRMPGLVAADGAPPPRPDTPLSALPDAPSLAEPPGGAPYRAWASRRARSGGAGRPRNARAGPRAAGGAPGGPGHQLLSLGQGRPRPGRRARRGQRGAHHPARRRAVSQGHPPVSGRAP